LFCKAKQNLTAFRLRGLITQLAPPDPGLAAMIEDKVSGGAGNGLDRLPVTRDTKL
jgi:hypothetical protein